MPESIKVSITQEVKEETLKNLLTSVREGGYSNSWIRQINVVGNEKQIEEDYLTGLYNAPFVEGGKWEIKVYDDKKKYTVDMDAIKKGTQIFFDKHPRHAADMMSENDDAITADVWFQCCALGELVYG